VDASNAKAAQQKVEIALAAQQERAATAENSLIKLRESLKDRTISGAQEKILIESLRGAPSGVVEIWWTASDTDSFGLARQMVEIFKKSGWPPATERFATGGTGNGFFLAVRDRFNAPSYAVSIQNAYKLIGIDMKKVVMWAFGRICYEDGISPIKRETRFCYEMSVDEKLETFMSQGGPAIYRMET